MNQPMIPSLQSPYPALARSRSRSRSGARALRPTPIAAALTLAVALSSTLMLVACGGSSSDNRAAEAPATPTALTLTGTAATGAALAARPVDARCNGGSASATSAADGTFALTLPAGAVLPCVLRVTLADASLLHSLAAGSASATTARANVTPVSELVLAQLAGGMPADYFTAFAAPAAATLTPAAVTAAQTAVVDALKTTGLDFSASAHGDVLTGPLVAANGSTAGNGLDRTLDALKAQMTATGTTLATLTSTLAAASPQAPATALSNAASLPAEMLLQPAAATCPSLRSGRYRIVLHEARSDGSFATEVLRIDARALTATNSANEVEQLTAHPTVGCRFKTPANGDLVVSPAGVFVAQASGQGRVLRAAIGFPEQTLPLARLAGEWNLLSFDRVTDNGPIVLTSATATLDSAGKVSALQQCDNLVSCQPGTAAELAALGFVGNPAGGFDFVNTSDRTTDRAFAYRAGGGEVMLVVVSSDGHIDFATRKVDSVLPSVGVVTENWSLTLLANPSAPNGVSDARHRIASTDSTNQRFSRNSVTNFTTGATRPESFTINSPRGGYSRRAPATAVAATDGSTSNVSEFISMPLRGMGVTPVAFPASNQLILSVSKVVN